MLFLALIAIFLVIAMTRPGPNRLFGSRRPPTGTMEIHHRAHSQPGVAADDPARPR